MIGIDHLVDGAVGYDDRTRLDTDTTAGTYPEEHRVLHLGVVHQLYYLVQKDLQRGYPYSVLEKKKICSLKFKYKYCILYCRVYREISVWIYYIYSRWWRVRVRLCTWNIGANVPSCPGVWFLAAVYVPTASGCTARSVPYVMALRPCRRTVYIKRLLNIIIHIVYSVMLLRLVKLSLLLKKKFSSIWWLYP